MRDTIDRYQMRANAAPRQIWDADDIYAENNVNPMRGYQGRANAAPRQIWNADDVNTPYAPLDPMFARYQGRANSGHPAIMNADDLKLSSVYGRKSGSMMRSVRGLGYGGHRWLGDVSEPSEPSVFEGEYKWWWYGAAAGAAGLAGYMIYKAIK